MTRPTVDASLADLLKQVAAAPSLPLIPDDQLEQGDRIAERFTVERCLGVGGMGSVYLTHDAELDRAVAVKVVRLDSDDRERERALREARAMARLSHPNVVTVHDVGLVDQEHLFIAMEYVDGGTARSWLADAPRRGMDVLRLYLQAGAGLVAAHAEGLIHRDFKPDNVLVSRDGRPRIADFGLARSHADAWPDPSGETDEHTLELPASGEASRTLPESRGGTRVAGTLAYMPPEQFAGSPLDARADQYSFCASLWEAMYGVRPHVGPGFLPDDAPRRPRTQQRPGVPRWVESVLRRGLSHDRAQRFPDMKALLEALERPMRRRTWWALAAGAAALAVGTGLVGFNLAEGRDLATCEAAANGADALWSAERSDRLSRALAVADATYGPTTHRAFESELHAWQASWSQAYQSACLQAPGADVGAGEQSPLQRARLECLDAQLGAVAAAIELIESPAEDAAADPAEDDGGPSFDPLLLRTESVTYAFPDPAECSRADALALRLRTDPAEDSPALLAVAEDFERLEALEMVGDTGAGLPLAQSLVERTRAPELQRLHAWALYRLGTIQRIRGDYEQSRDTLTEAYFASRALDLESQTTSAAIGLVWTEGMALGELESAKQWARHAEAAMHGRDDDVQQRAALESTLGVLDEYLGDYESAIEHHDRALAFTREGYGPHHPLLANALSNRGAALDASGRIDEAFDAYEEALEVRNQAIARPDSMKSVILSNRGLIAVQRGDTDAAVADQRASLEILEQLVPADSPQLITSLLNLGIALTHAGQLEEAMKHLNRADELTVTKLGPDHPDVGYVAHGLASALYRLGRVEEAARQVARAKAVIAQQPSFDPGERKQIDELADQLAAELDAEGTPPDLEGRVPVAANTAK